MSFTYDPILGLAKPSDGDTSWGDEMRNNLTYLAKAMAPKYAYFVSPDFTTAALGNGSATDRRHFDTIQGAIDAIEDWYGPERPPHFGPTFAAARAGDPNALPNLTRIAGSAAP